MKIFKVKTFALSLIASLIIFFTTLFYSIENSNKLNEATISVNHTHEVIHKSKSLQFRIYEVESEVRTYFITGRNGFIKDFPAKFSNIEKSIENLQVFVSENPLQLQNFKVLKKLILARKECFEGAITTYRNTKNIADSAFFNYAIKGSLISDKIIEEFSKIEKAERQILTQKSEMLKSSQTGSFLFNFIGGLCALFMASISTAKLFKHLKELKIAQKELEQREEKLTVIYNSTSDALLVLDYTTFNIVDCNVSTLELFEEANKTKLLGIDFLEMGNLPSKGEGKQNIYTSLQESDAWDREVVFKTKSDKVFWGEVHFSKAVIDNNDRIIVRITDVTKRKLAEKEVQETSQVLNGILNNLPVIVYKLDPIGTITQCKGKGLKTVGLFEEELIGANVYKYFPHIEEEKTNAYHWNSHVFNSLNESDGREYFLEHYLFDDPDNAGGLVGFAVDITSNKEAQKELILEKQKAEMAATARQKFLSTMSHEIRTPLNAIIGMTHLLLQDKLTNQQQQRLNILMFSGENLLNTLNDILDFSKIESGGVEFAQSDFNLSELLKNTKESFQSLADKKAIKLKLVLEDSLPLYLKGDSHRLQQVLNNLLNNAIKFTSQGSVSLQVNLEEEGDEKVFLSFLVKDSGIGIPKDKLQTIFEPFKQAEADTSRKFGGTGLGLAIIKNIVELQGGSISVESEENKGSEFKVFLGYTKSSVTQKAVQREEKLTSLRGAKVLYVEDVAVNQLLLEGFCELWNVELDVASSGKEALLKVQKRKYDLILMDIQMPDMDGYETTRRIRTIQGEYFNKVPIIALSAEVSEEVKTKIYKAGMNGFLSKPIVPSDLHSTIQKQIPDKEIGHLNFHEPNEMVMEGSIDFEVLDRLFSEQQDEYVKFLDNILNDFSKNLREIKACINEKDGELFSEIRHKLLSILKIMKSTEVLEVLDQIKNDFNSGIIAEKEEMIDNLNFVFDQLNERICQKIESIKTLSQ